MFIRVFVASNSSHVNNLIQQWWASFKFILPSKSMNWNQLVVLLRMLVQDIDVAGLQVWPLRDQRAIVVESLPTSIRCLLPSFFIVLITSRLQHSNITTDISSSDMETLAYLVSFVLPSHSLHLRRVLRAWFHLSMTSGDCIRMHALHVICWCCGWWGVNGEAESYLRVRYIYADWMMSDAASLLLRDQCCWRIIIVIIARLLHLRPCCYSRACLRYCWLAMRNCALSSHKRWWAGTNIDSQTREHDNTVTVPVS